MYWAEDVERMQDKLSRWQPGYFKAMLTVDKVTVEKRKTYVKDKKEQVRLAKLVRPPSPLLPRTH